MCSQLVCLVGFCCCPLAVVVVVVGRFHIALFSALEQTHALACDSA